MKERTEPGKVMTLLNNDQLQANDFTHALPIIIKQPRSLPTLEIFNQGAVIFHVCTNITTKH